MPTSTSRLMLQQPVGSDPPSEYRLSITANTDILDAAVLEQSGTISGRPSASSVPSLTMYEATDTGQVFIAVGSSWLLVAPHVSRQSHSFTLDDATEVNSIASIIGSFPIHPANGESVTLVGASIRCSSQGATPSVFEVVWDHGAHGTFSGVPGLTSLTPAAGGSMLTLVTSGPLALADADTIGLKVITAGTTVGWQIAAVTEHTA